MVVGEDFWLRIPMNNESAGRHLCMDDVEVIHAWLESGYGGCWTLQVETDGEQLEGVAVKVPGSRLGLGTYAVVMAGKFVNGGHFRTKRQLFIRLVDREEQADAKPTMFNEEKAYWAGPAVLSEMLSRDGLNTYELAVIHGFEGTLEEFLAQAGIELQDFMVTKAKLSREVQTLLDKGSEKGITPMGAYSNLVNYSVNNMVYDEGTNSSYISLQSENQGHAVTDEAWWKKTFDGNYVLNAIMEAAQQTLDAAKADTEQATANAIKATSAATSATAAATAAKDAANAVAAQKVAQAQIGYYECNSLATDATKVTTSGTIGTDTYVITQNGGQMKIRMNKANSVDSNVKLQIGNTTALPLYYNGEAVSASNTWEDGEVVSVYFDGTNYQAFNSQGGGGKIELTLAYILGNHERRVRNNEEHKLGEDEELVIARALQESQGSSGGESSLSGSVTIVNSDCITIIGSSFGAGYTITGKHWTDIVSMFSDYCFQNLSLSGTSSLDRMNSLLAGTITPRQNSRYAMLVNNENTSVNHKYLLKEIDNLCKVCVSMGMQPIVGTSYRNYLGNTQQNQYVSSLYREYCKRNGYIFMDAGRYYQLLAKGDYDFNGGGSHLNERRIPVVAYAYMNALKDIERPIKSIKLFTPRTTVEELDDLVFNDNIGRAKKFKEYLLNDYTNPTLTFSNGYALISAILPCEQKSTKNVSLEFSTEQDVTVYVRKTNKRPWPVKDSLCTRFHIEEEITLPSVGDTYTYNSKTYTVKYVKTNDDGSYGAFCDLYCQPNETVDGSTTSGVLVRATGSGSENIPFSSYNIDTSYSSDTQLVIDFNGGHWEELPAVEGKYSLTSLYGIMDIDRVDFLIKSDDGESFSVAGSTIKVNWEARELKSRVFRLYNEEFQTTYFSKNTELLTEPTFGTPGTACTTWKDGSGNAIVPENNYEKAVLNKNGIYPLDATSIIKVSDSVSMNCTIPASKLSEYGQVVIEIIARNFGTDFSHDVTTDSWDFNELKVGFGGGSDGAIRCYSELSDQVGLFWKICQFTIDICPLNGKVYTLPLKIYAEKAGMEIARVSVKYKNY